MLPQPRCPSLGPGVLVYRCKRCKQEIRDVRVENAVEAIVRSGYPDVTNAREPPRPRIKRHDVHWCSRGVLGVTMLIGADLDSVPKSE